MRTGVPVCGDVSSECGRRRSWGTILIAFCDEMRRAFSQPLANFNSSRVGFDNKYHTATGVLALECETEILFSL